MDISITPSKDYDKRELGSSDKIKTKLAALREEAADKQWTFEVGYTTAMDFAIEKITGLKPPERWLEQAKLQNSLARSMEESKRMSLGKCVASAAKFNWADQNGVTPVRDQGGCGSCWAFATHGAFEGSNAILNKAQIDSAEQDTLDCSGSGSCSGGWWAFQYLIDKGSAKEADYPYVATKGTCKAGVQRPYKAVAWGYVDSTVEIPSVAALKKALCDYGPLAVAVAVTVGPGTGRIRSSVFTAHTSAPRISPMFAMLEPTTLPSAMSADASRMLGRLAIASRTASPRSTSRNVGCRRPTRAYSRNALIMPCIRLAPSSAKAM